MSTIEFDRAAVGVSAKADWTDSYTFGTIGSFIGSLYPVFVHKFFHPQKIKFFQFLRSLSRIIQKI